MTKASELTYQEELQRIAQKYGCDDIHGIKDALEAGNIERGDAKQLLVELGSPMHKIKLSTAMKTAGLSNKPQPGTAEEACVQAAMEIIMQLLKDLLGICTAEDIEREHDQQEALQHKRNIEQKHGSLMQFLTQIDTAANDDEYITPTKMRSRTP